MGYLCTPVTLKVVIQQKGSITTRIVVDLRMKWPKIGGIIRKHMAEWLQ